MDSSGKKNSLPNCEWTVTIANCVDQNYYQIIYNITIYLSLIVFLCAVGLLSWRKYSKPEAKLFCIKGFLAMEGFLFTQIFWGMLRVIDCFVLIYDYFPTNMILREMLFTVSWLLGSISVTTYLAGILRTIPRMHFYRQNPEYKTLYLPSIQNTAIIYFCYIFTLGITLTTCSFFIGYLETNPNSIAIAYVLKSVEFSVFAICCFLMSLGYIIYGSKLISIASEGIHLLEGVNDYQSHIKTKNSRNTTHSLSGLELEIKHKKLKRSVRKMRIINISFISSIIILGIILASSAIFCKQLYENLISNKIFAAFTNLFPMLVNVAVMAGIAYGEMRVHNKYEIGFENNITSSISTNNPLPPRESIETIAVHTRDPSTDSESPLLLLPPPVILSTMYHHNHYGGSGGNNSNGNLSNNIRSNNISSNNLRSNNISRNNISSNNVSRNDIGSNNISRNDIYRNNNSGRSSFATTTSSLNSPINSTPMRINYSYI